MLLYSSLAFNLVYATVHLIAGGWYHSPWMIGLGGYHGMLAIMRFHLMRRIRKGTDEGKWKAYRGTAFMLLALTAVIGGIVTATFLLNKTYDYPGMLVYAFAENGARMRAPLRDARSMPLCFRPPIPLSL